MCEPPPWRSISKGVAPAKDVASANWGMVGAGEWQAPVNMGAGDWEALESIGRWRMVVAGEGEALENGSR
jgi:hypothetical protein